MAQTKTKPKKRSTGGKPTGGSKKSSGSAKRRSPGASAKKSKSAPSRAKSKSQSTSSKAKSNSRSSATKSKAKSTKSKSSANKSNGGGRSALEKMKVPATVAGAAMLAAAGGLAASKNGSKGGLLPGRGSKLGLPSPKSGLKSLKKADLSKSLKKVDLSKVDLPKPEEAIDWVEEKAKGVGDAGYRVAELSSQAQSLRKRFSGD